MQDPINDISQKVSPSQLGPSSVDLPKEIHGSVDISYAARALGVEDGSRTVATEALRELAKTCLIRFGIQPAAQETLAQALSVSLDAVRNTNTLETSKLPNEEWRRLASKMRFPSDEPLLGAYFEVTSADDLRRLIGEISKLRAEVSNLIPLDATLAHHARNALPRLREMVREGDPDPKLADFVAHCARQITLAERLGVEWTRVHPRERAFMQTLLAEGLLKSADRSAELTKDPITDLELCNRLLNQVGMQAKFVEQRNQLEPFLNNTRFYKTSVFQRSSHYFNSVLEKTQDNQSPAVRRFFRELRDIQELYEGNSFGEAVLRDKQRGAFRRLLQAL